MKIKERYDTIMSKVYRFDSHIEDKSHEEVAEFYQMMFDSMESVASDLFSLCEDKEATNEPNTRRT
jgi:hypothetical protein